MRMSLAGDASGNLISIPLMIAHGQKDGPILGITAAIHGDELNGLKVIHRLFQELNPKELVGTILAVPVVNMPGFLRNQRFFSDGQDLNRIMPGKPGGNCAQVYAHRFIERIISKLDRLVDLHTASFGRVNAFYVRANLEHEATAQMAYAQHPQILLHNPSHDDTLRAAAMERGIPAITVEVGDPMLFQKKMIRFGFQGLANILSQMGMVDLEEEPPNFDPVICNRSYWLYTDHGGLLNIDVELRDKVKKGQRIARVTDIFGQLLKEYHAPESGVIIGRSTNPVNQTGSRIVHLGIPVQTSE